MSSSQSQPANAPTSAPQNSGIMMYTTSWCSDCRRAKRIFAARSIPYTEVDIEDDATAAELVTRLNAGKRSVPTILFPDGTKLVEPSNAVLEAKLVPFARESR